MGGWCSDSIIACFYMFQMNVFCGVARMLLHSKIYAIVNCCTKKKKSVIQVYLVAVHWKMSYINIQCCNNIVQTPQLEPKY